MRIWIDVEDAAGRRIGEGPIVTASDWRFTRRLDGAGSFEFAMPAADERSNLLAHKRVVRCWQADETGLHEQGAGVIEEIEITPSGQGPTMLRVRGDDLLRELTNRTVGDLALHEAVTYSTTHATDPVTLRIEEVYSDMPWMNFGYDLTLPAQVQLMNGNPLRFLYIQHPRAFSKITLTLTDVNTVQSDTFQVQYYNAQDPAKPAWEPLGGLVNNTSAPGEDPGSEFVYPLGMMGEQTIEFDVPTGWSPLEGGPYIIRMFDPGVVLGPCTISAASVTIVEPVADGLQRIMALAPAGWSLDPAGRYATAGKVYMQFAGESVLSALVLLAEQTGEHFTLSAAARRVWWLGVMPLSSGLRAIQVTEPGEDTMAITAFSRVADSYELYTRLYAYGAGEGSGRLTMAASTNAYFMPAGFHIDPVNREYIEHSEAAAVYGRIDRREDWPDIAPVDGSKAQMIHAANALYGRALLALQRHSQLQYAYRLTVAPSHYVVWPGQTILVEYHEWADGYHSVNVAAELWVLETDQQITSAGLRTMALTVATVDYAPANDYSTVARLMGSVRQERSTEQVASGYSNNSAGVPVHLTVRNGQIVGLGRVRPVDDGWYTLSGIQRIKVEKGLIANVQMA